MKMTWGEISLALKAIVAIVPYIVFLVRDGRIKKATQEEVINEMLALSKDRVDRAVDARNAPDDGLPDDENDRSRRSGTVG